MLAVLIALTVVEVVVLIAALAVYLLLISRSLRNTAMSLGRVTFGVRAIETQTAKVGHSLPVINSRLTDLAGGLVDLTGAAEGRLKDS